MAADQNETAVAVFQTTGLRLCKRFSSWRHVDRVDPLPRLLTDIIPTPVKGIGLYNCPAAAPIGIIVYLLLLVDSIIPNLVAIYTDIAPLLPTAQNGLAEHIPHHVRE